MSRLPREPEAFGEQVLKILQRHFPDHPAELAGPLELAINGRRLGLENLYRMVLFDPDRGVEIVENYLEHIAEGDVVSSTPMPLSIAKPRIMPRIQPEDIFDRNLLDRQNVAHVPYVNGTVIVFVIDMPHVTVSLTMEQVIKWGMDIDDVEAIARANLDKYTPEIEIQLVDSVEGGRAAIVAVQDGYDAARLLLGQLHERLSPELHGDFLVALPARDMFLAVTQKPDDFVSRIHERVRRDFRRLPYPITSDFFVVTQDGVAGTREAA